MSRRLPPWRDGFVHVRAEKCSTCVFHPGNRMRLPPGRLKDLVDQNVTNQAALVCHQTLPYGPNPELGEAICRGYFDGPGADTLPMVLARAMDVVREVP
jgi:hypothetical protein